MVAEYRNLTGDLTLTTFVPEYLKSGNRKLIYQLFVKKKTLARSDVVSLTNMSFPTEHRLFYKKRNNQGNRFDGWESQQTGQEKTYFGIQC